MKQEKKMQTSVGRPGLQTPKPLPSSDEPGGSSDARPSNSERNARPDFPSRPSAAPADG